MNDNELDIQTLLNCTPEEFYKKYTKYKKAEAEFKKIYEPFKDGLIKLHAEKPDLDKTVMIDGVKITYVSPSTRTTLDSKKLREEEPELAKKFMKTTNVAATLRLEGV